MLKRFIFALVGFFLMLSSSVSVAAETPEVFVERVSNEVLTAIAADPKVQAGDKKAVERLVDDLMMPNVDFLRMTRMAVGPKWRQATPEQQQRLQYLFRETLISVYSGGLSLASDQTVRILPHGQNDGTEAIVRTGMKSKSDPSKPEVVMVYRLRNVKEKGWQVIDVNVEGVWLVSNYRSQYGTIAAQEGIDGLIRRMEERLKNTTEKK